LTFVFLFIFYFTNTKQNNRRLTFYHFFFSWPVRRTSMMSRTECVQMNDTYENQREKRGERRVHFISSLVPLDEAFRSQTSGSEHRTRCQVNRAIVERSLSVERPVSRVMGHVTSVNTSKVSPVTSAPLRSNKRRHVVSVPICRRGELPP